MRKSWESLEKSMRTINFKQSSSSQKKLAIYFQQSIISYQSPAINLQQLIFSNKFTEIISSNKFPSVEFQQ